MCRTGSGSVGNARKRQPYVKVVTLFTFGSQIGLRRQKEAGALNTAGAEEKVKERERESEREGWEWQNDVVQSEGLLML
jgi:hypothetical protein